jgi:SLIT-ROBO Rho GTPase activating protein
MCFVDLCSIEFSIPGKQSSIKQLREQYDRGQPVQLNASYTPATISSLLKTYLQSLPEPIVPIQYFDQFLEIGSRLKYSQHDELDRLKHLIETCLDAMNVALLAYLCSFLKTLTKYEHRTKMDTENLALTFGNNLIRSSEELDLNMIKGHK